MSSEYLARLFQQRSQTRIIRFDEQICRFVAKNMKVAAFKYMGRLDRPQNVS